MSKSTRPTTKATSSAPQSLGVIDQLESIGNHGLWITLGFAVLMLVVIYWDMLTGARVLLFKDIGSDSINIFYPQWVQWTKLWETYGATSGFSLETVMGQSIGFNVWSPFDWLIATGGTANIPQNVAYVEMLKALITSALGYFVFRYQQFTNVTSIIGGLCLGFCGYIALGASGWPVHSAEAMFMVLALWIAEYALAKKPFYYVVMPILLAYLAIMTSYLFIYLSAALFVYFLARTFTSMEQRQALKASGILIGLLLVGMALSYNTFQSTFALATSSGRAESIKQAATASTYGTKMDVSMFDTAPRAEYSNIILRAYSNNAMGSGSSFRGMMNYLEAPLLYYGLPMLLFLPFVFVGQDKKSKIIFGALLGMCFVLLLFPWFRFAFWGFKLDYFREYTMLIGVVMLLLAMRGLNNIVTSPYATIKWLAPASVFVVLILPFTLAKPAALFDPSQKTVIALLILGYGAALVSFAYTRRKDLLIALVLVTVLDLTLNANTTINKRDLLTTREIEQGALYGGSSLKAVNWIRSQNSGLYRIVNFNPSSTTIHKSLNDAMVQGYNGIIGYSSFHNKYFLRFMAAMGCRDPRNPSEAKWVFKAILRPYLASILGMKYVLVSDKPMGFDPEYFPLVKQIDNIYVHESKLAMPLLVAYDSFITEDEFSALPEGRNDYMLYKAAVLGGSDASKVGRISHYNIAADTITAARNTNFVQAAQALRSNMTVEQSTTTQNGITASITMQRPGLVVVSIPYDENITVTIDGTPTTPVLANLGFIGFNATTGKHNVNISMLR